MKNKKGIKKEKWKKYTVCQLLKINKQNQKMEVNTILNEKYERICKKIFKKNQKNEKKI